MTTVPRHPILVWAPAKPREKLDLTGHVYGRLSVLREERMQGNHRMWRCGCECGMQTVTRQARLRSGETTSCGCVARERIGRHRLTAAEEVPSYEAWHARLRRAFGPASNHECVESGDHDGVVQWSYMNGCADEVEAEHSSAEGVVLRYCVHVTHYDPRCLRHHKIHDRKALAA